MKPLIMYYSYTGNCKKEAANLSKMEAYAQAELLEIKETKPRSRFNTFFFGCPGAMLRKKSKIEHVDINLEAYNPIVFVAPIWSGYPAPAFNSMVELLPGDKDVELYICSGGGEAPKSKAGTCELITKKGCHLNGYHDIKTSGILPGNADKTTV